MRIVLPLPPNRANARGHWRAQKRKRDNYMVLCNVEHPTRPPQPLTPVRISARLYVHNRMDEDNLVARLKWPIDWLVSREIIADDDPTNMRLAEISQEIDRKNPRVELEVEVVH